MIENTRGMPPPMAIPVKARVQYSCHGEGKGGSGGGVGQNGTRVSV